MYEDEEDGQIPQITQSQTLPNTVRPQVQAHGNSITTRTRLPVYEDEVVMVTQILRTPDISDGGPVDIHAEERLLEDNNDVDDEEKKKGKCCPCCVIS